MNPPAVSKKRENESEPGLIVAISTALAVSLSPETGIALGTALLHASLKRSGRKLEAHDIRRLAAVALIVTIISQIFRDWPDFKHGLLQGLRGS
jgi:hypothetical protein